MLSSKARWLIVLAAAVSLCGCAAAFQGNTRYSTSSSLVDYLYPEGERPAVDPEIRPSLELPLRVGIAFVPNTTDRWRPSLDPTEARRMQLLEQVKAAFEMVDYVEAIEIVPSHYLGSAGGFAALEQASRLHGLDVFALVSWDQVVNTEETPLSVLYWTIIGGYVIPASKNSVHTLLDTAVFDVRTQKLLLRAPGIDHSALATTAVDAERGRQEVSNLSFERATATMIGSLELEIERFGERVKDDKSVNIAYSRGYSGSSASPLVLLALALAILVAPGGIRKNAAKQGGMVRRRD